MNIDSSKFTSLKNYMVKSTYTPPLSEHMNSIIVWNPPNLREMLYKVVSQLTRNLIDFK